MTMCVYFSFYGLFAMFDRVNNEMWEIYIEREREKNESLFLVLEGEKDKRSVLNGLLPSILYYTVKFETNEWHATCSMSLIYSFLYSNQQNRRHKDDLKRSQNDNGQYKVDF